METERICAVCKKDCGASERLKDKKGRYFHKACYERAKKAALAKQQGASAAPQPRRAAPAPRPAAPASCPNCNAMLQPGAVMCTTCGFNLQTGQLMPMLSSVKFDNTPPKKSGGGAKISLPSGSLGSLVKNPIVLAACAAGIFGVLFLMGMSNSENAYVYLTAMRLFGFVVGIWVLIDAFREGAVHGILCFFCGLYTLYYVYGVSSNQNLKIAYTLSIVLFVGGVGLIGANFDALMDPSFSPDSVQFEDGAPFEVGTDFGSDDF